MFVFGQVGWLQDALAGRLFVRPPGDIIIEIRGADPGEPAGASRSMRRMRLLIPDKKQADPKYDGTNPLCQE